VSIEREVSSHAPMRASLKVLPQAHALALRPTAPIGGAGGALYEAVAWQIDGA